MKKSLLITSVFLAGLFISANAQKQPYKVAFDLTSGQQGTYDRIIRWANGITKEHADAQISIVFYGKSLPMVEKATTTHADAIAALIKTGRVKFSVCENAMRVHKVSHDMLLPNVETVPDAIYELIQKQAEGYGYIKVVD